MPSALSWLPSLASSHQARCGGERPSRDRRNCVKARRIDTMTQLDEKQTSDLPASPVAEARWFRVLADPTRLVILKHLLTRPHSVTELIGATGLPQSRIS